MSDDWNVYRTRFLVRAKQLTEFVEFTDSLGRQHSGKPGDYLVQSSEGMLRVAPREIFEDVYVALSENSPPSFSTSNSCFSPSRGQSLSHPQRLPS
jgi:hypothetical protein